jgi:hypothetical protein
VVVEKGLFHVFKLFSSAVRPPDVVYYVDERSKKNHFENPLSLQCNYKNFLFKKKMNRPVSPTHFIAFPLFDWAGLFMDYLKKHFKWKTGKKHFQELAWLIFFWLTSTRLFVCRLQSKQSTDN